uniref:Uncharacterized protein n=1 Tax=Glossina austeni TaxID=7395 RepID=A0A1A9VWB7_GLOAU
MVCITICATCTDSNSGFEKDMLSTNAMCFMGNSHQQVSCINLSTYVETLPELISLFSQFQQLCKNLNEMLSSKSHVFKHNNPKPEKSVTLSLTNKTNKMFPLQTWKTIASLKHATYVKNLEREYEQLQTAFLQLTSQYARVQFRLRQLLQATPRERDSLIRDLARVTFSDFEFLSEDEREEMPHLQHDNQNLGDIKRKQHKVIEKLRYQICNLQKVRTCTTDLSTSYLENRAKQAGICNRKYKSCSSVLNEIKSLKLITEDAPGVSHSELPCSNSSLVNEHECCSLPADANSG